MPQTRYDALPMQQIGRTEQDDLLDPTRSPLFALVGASEAVLSALPHLSRSTAHRHVLLLGKEHTALRGCTGWWANPTGELPNLKFAAHHPLPNHLTH